MRKLLTFLLSFLIMVSMASSLLIEKEYPINVVVPQYNQPAEAVLTISDTLPGRYNIYTLTDVSLVPSQSFELQEGENRIDVKIYPLTSLNSRSFYTFVYYLKDFTGKNNEDKMTIKVVDLEDLLEISSDSNYPGNEMTFYIKNKENARLKNLSVEFSSVFFEFKDTFNLEPFEKKEFTVSVNQEEIKKIPAGSYLLESTFKTDRGDVTLAGKIFFGEKKGIETKQDMEGLLIRTEKITKINFGNTIETVRIESTRSVLASSFTFFSEKPEGVERTGLTNKYYWVKRINPSETVEIKVRTNYLLPLLIIFVLVITILTFRKYTKAKLEIKKSVSHVKTKGGEFALRVRLHIKAHRSLENVSVIEKIPPIVKVYENFGAVKPSSINLTDRRLQWDLGNLQAGEERMFSYIVYSKVGVVGKFSLQGATGIFEENGTVNETFSNSVFFLSEQVNKVD